MGQSIFKRALALGFALLMIVALGCKNAAAEADQGATATPEVVAFGGDVLAESSGNAESADHTGIYNVDETTDEASSGSYASSTPNENTVLVQNAGVLSMTSADLNKTGDAENDFSSGVNAAIAVVTKGQMTLSDSNVTASALGAFGCYVSGSGSNLTMSGSYIYTSGDSSPALVAHDGSMVTMSGGILSTEGMDSPGLLLSGGSVTLSGVTVKAANDKQLRVLEGNSTLTLDATALAADPIIAENATLLLKLTNGASFTGALGSALPARANVSLDATSTLGLTEDTYVGVFSNADVAHQNVQSNGFSLYYDSNAAENAYLNSQSFALPGGGFLSPII